MAYSIGPVIAIKGDREYNKAIADIRQNARYLAAEMKNVTSEFNINEKSIEALTKKNAVLDKSLKDQEKAVKETEAALKRLTDAGIDPTVKEYKDLEHNLNLAKAAFNETNREIGDNAKAMKELGEKQDTGQGKTKGYTGAISKLSEVFGVKIPDDILKSIDGLAGFEGAIEGADGKARSGFGNIVNAIGNIDPATLGAIGAISAISVAIAKMVIESELELDKLNAKLQVGLGLTEEEARGATGSVQNIYRQYVGGTDEKEGLAQAEQALTAVMRLMKASGDEAETYAGQVVALNRAFGEDFSEVAKTAGTMMETFGVTGQEALDLIAYGLQTSANKNGDLLDVLNEYSPAFARLGDDAQTFLSRLIAGTDAGASSADKAADVYKELFNKAADGNADFKASIEALGLSGDATVRQLLAGGDTAQRAVEEIFKRLENVKDVTRQNQIASKLLSAQWEDVGTRAPLAMAKVSGAIVDTTNESIKSAEIVTGTVSSKLETMWKEIWSFIRTPVMAAVPFGAAINAYNSLIPRYATGTAFHPGGGAIVGENGPEYIDLPRGSKVYTNAQLSALWGKGGTEIGTINIHPNFMQWNELMQLLRTAQNARITQRAGYRR